MNANINISTKDESEKSSDMYTELMKLNNLKEKGILSEEEFKQQKQKILNQKK